MRQVEDREFFTDNLLVRIHFIIVMIRWTGLVPWQFEFPFPGSLTSTFLIADKLSHAARKGQVAEVKALLETGADANHVDEQGYTPLHLACVGGDLPVISTLTLTP